MGTTFETYSRQSLQSSSSKSGVHCTSAYIVFRSEAAESAANLRSEPPDAALLLRTCNKVPSLLLNSSTSETFLRKKPKLVGCFSITPNMDRFEYRSMQTSNHMTASFSLGQTSIILAVEFLTQLRQCSGSMSPLHREIRFTVLG